MARWVGRQIGIVLLLALLLVASCSGLEAGEEKKKELSPETIKRILELKAFKNASPRTRQSLRRALGLPEDIPEGAKEIPLGNIKRELLKIDVPIDKAIHLVTAEIRNEPPRDALRTILSGVKTREAALDWWPWRGTITISAKRQPLIQVLDDISDQLHGQQVAEDTVPGPWRRTYDKGAALHLNVPRIRVGADGKKIFACTLEGTFFFERALRVHDIDISVTKAKMSGTPLEARTDYVIPSSHRYQKCGMFGMDFKIELSGMPDGASRFDTLAFRVKARTPKEMTVLRVEKLPYDGVHLLPISDDEKLLLDFQAKGEPFRVVSSKQPNTDEAKRSASLHLLIKERDGLGFPVRLESVVKGEGQERFWLHTTRLMWLPIERGGKYVKPKEVDLEVRIPHKSRNVEWQFQFKRLPVSAVKTSP